MPFVQVDPSQIKFDAPVLASSVPQGFVKVDPSQITFDKPALAQPSGGGITDIAKDTMESLKNAATSTGEAISEPLNNPNAGSFADHPILNTLDAGVRTVGKLGNVIGGVFGAATSPLTGALTASVENSGIIPAAANAIKQNLVPNDPRFHADITPVQQHQVATGIGNDLANAVMAGKGGIQGAENLAARQAAGVPPPFNPYDIKTPEGYARQNLLKSNSSDPMLAEKPPLTDEQVKNASSNAYTFVDQSGTVLNPSVTDKALSIIDSAKQKPLFNGTVLTEEQAGINKALSDYEGASGQPMTMTDLQGLDSTLGDKAAQAYVSGDRNKGRIISDVQDKIRELVQPKNLTPDDISGTPEGISALTDHAIPAWATQAKMADIGKIIERANYMDNPSPAMRNGFKNLALNKGKMAQYPPEVQALIQKAAVTGKADDLLGILGSRLNPIIAGAAGGGLPATAATLVSSGIMRGIRSNMKYTQADKILSALSEPMRGTVEKFGNGVPEIPYHNFPPQPPAAPMLALPAPKTTYYGNGAGQTVPLTPAARDIIGQSPSTAIEQAPSNMAAQSGANTPMYQPPIAKISPDEIAAARQAGMSPDGYAAMRQSKLAEETANKQSIRKEFEENTAWNQNSALTEAQRQQSVNNIYDQMQSPTWEKLSPQQKSDASTFLIQNEIQRQQIPPENQTDFGAKVKQAMTMSPAEARKFLKRN